MATGNLGSAVVAFLEENGIEDISAVKTDDKLRKAFTKYIKVRGLVDDLMFANLDSIGAKPKEGEQTPKPPQAPHVAKAKRIPDYQGVFSKKMEGFITANAECLGVLPDGVIGTVLASCSAALSRDCVLRIGSSWKESPTLWVAVVGGSSSKKTPTMKLCSRFFVEKQKEFIGENKATMKLFKKQQVQYENELKRWKTLKMATINQQPDEPDLPEMKSLYLTDGTIEAMINICKANPRGIMYFRDELSSWVAQLQRKDHEKEVGSWLQAFNGDPIVKQTITGGEVACDSFRVVVFGGVQPHVMPKILNEDVVDGLAPRFLMVNHDATGTATNEISNDYGEYMFSLLSKLFAMGKCEMRATPEAEKSLTTWADEFETEARKVEEGHWRSFLGKRSGFIMRIAIILHAIDMAELGLDITAQQISLDVARRAKRFCDGFATPSVEMIYSKAGVSIPNDDGIAFNADEKRVIRWMIAQAKEGKTETTVRLLRRHCRPYQKLQREKKSDYFLENLVVSGICSITANRADNKVLTFSEYIKEIEL